MNISLNDFPRNFEKEMMHFFVNVLGTKNTLTRNEMPLTTSDISSVGETRKLDICASVEAFHI